MNRTINKVAVLGSGVMGSQIACHFANIGVEVLLLDIVPKELDEEDKEKDLTKESPAFRNKIVNNALEKALEMSPSPIYLGSFAERITTGNFEDDFSKIEECDWAIEAVTEQLEIKNSVFEQVDEYRKKGTIVSSNTSGIPIHLMIKDRSDDFKKHFLGTHFFNPPRYLELLELIPAKETDEEVISFLSDYGKRFLGKTTVICKDTPAFIANRVGVYSIMSIFHLTQELDLSIEAIDQLTGKIIGHPKSATYRTADMVGLDTLVHVANGLYENCKDDEARDLFKIPPYIQKMVDNEWLGSKSGQGFYLKKKDDEGNSTILSLDFDSMEYSPRKKESFPALEMAKNANSDSEKMKMLISAKGKAGEFYRKTFFGLFEYVSKRIPEIADELYKIDAGMRAGFNWQDGPFETWDVLGVEKTVQKMKEAGHEPPGWVNEMLENGFDRFYTVEDGNRKYYDIESSSYKTIPGTEDLLILSDVEAANTVWENDGATISDLGDGILNISFHTKMNSIGSEVLQGLNKAIDLAEDSYKGLVVYNEGENFSAGANVGMIFMLAVEQELEELDLAVRQFQNTMRRMRYSSIPVIAAPHNRVLGGGCELCMHSDKVIAHAETYMGLVEFGVGLVPAGGGTTEFIRRLSDEFRKDDIRTNQFRKRFLTIAQAEVSTSAYEAFDYGYLRPGTDEVVVSRDYQLKLAKQHAKLIAEKGYTQPQPRKDITVLGNEGLGIAYLGADSFEAGNYISEYDKFMAEKLGFVMSGGDLSEPMEVSEEYLTNLERKTFLSLCTQRKSLERLESMVKRGKVLRN